MEVEIRIEPGRQEPKVVILAGEESEELRRLADSLSTLPMGPIPVGRGEEKLLLPQGEFLRFYADGKGVSGQTAEETCGSTSWRSGWTRPGLSASPTVRSSTWTGSQRWTCLCRALSA